jgi:diacylglycerol kinase family enzyme
MTELRAAGVQAEAVPTRGPGTAGEQAREVVASGVDAVFACGGDGTVHEVLQGMVGTSAAMGVIPLGTANALAVDLGIPRNPAVAVRMLLAAMPTRIATGRMEYCHGAAGSRPDVVSRYFTVAAGIGPDAHLFYSMNYAAKKRFGNPWYYGEAVRVWATHNYPLFEVEYSCGEQQPPQRAEVSQVLAVRITSFGGMLRHLAPGAALKNDCLRLVLFKTRSRVRYLQYMTAVCCGRVPNVAGIEFADATSVQCRPLDGATCRIHAEADGELLGALPARLSIVPDAVTLLMPRLTNG